MENIPEGALIKSDSNLRELADRSLSEDAPYSMSEPSEFLDPSSSVCKQATG